MIYKATLPKEEHYISYRQKEHRRTNLITCTSCFYCSTNNDIRSTCSKGHFKNIPLADAAERRVKNCEDKKT